MTSFCGSMGCRCCADVDHPPLDFFGHDRGKRQFRTSRCRPQVTNDGTVPFRTGERIAFTYLISQKYTGETATVDILRNGEEMSVDIQ